jgi:hypothetical protein
MHFGVRVTRSFMQTVPNDDAVVGDDTGANNRIGCRAPQSTRREHQSATHECAVGRIGPSYHFS